MIWGLMLTPCHFYCNFYRPTVSSAISRLCRQAMDYRPAVMEWLYIVPLYHFMNDVSKPYMKLDSIPRIDARAEDANLNLKNFKNKTPDR